MLELGHDNIIASYNIIVGFVASDSVFHLEMWLHQSIVIIYNVNFYTYN